ncbi:hypothetical protein DB346_05475 [Verrucomicrobia bacterium LW23]|nr:hypothetical protein DB346_05475 [Verrucomicrobia bacterium LW23]
MASQGIFTVGFTISEILQIQQQAKKMLLEGKTVMSWTDTGTTTTKQFPMTVREVLEECAYALRKLQPAAYPSAPVAASSSVCGYLPK